MSVVIFRMFSENKESTTSSGVVTRGSRCGGDIHFGVGGHGLQVAEHMKVVKKSREKFGKFFFRFPEGESAADVYDRVTGQHSATTTTPVVQSLGPNKLSSLYTLWD